MAEHFSASKTSVNKLATKEDWQRRVQEIEAKARAASDEKAAETMEAINGRHLKAMRIVQGKAMEALRSMTLADAMDAVRALDMAVRQERLILGEPTDRNAVNVEEILRAQQDRWLVPVEKSQNGHVEPAPADATPS